jgi:hypothetical protein
MLAIIYFHSRNWGQQNGRRSQNKCPATIDLIHYHNLGAVIAISPSLMVQQRAERCQKKKDKRKEEEEKSGATFCPGRR